MIKKRPFGWVTSMSWIPWRGYSFQWNNRKKVQGINREYNNKDSEYRRYQIYLKRKLC